MMIKNKKIFLFIMILLFLASSTIVSAAENNTQTIYENDISNNQNTQQEEFFNSNDYLSSNDIKQDSINKNLNNESKTAVNSQNSNTITLTTNVENKSIALVYDTDNEVVITKNITTVNGKPDVTKLGVDYAYADENGVYTILGSEIRRVMKLDSYCQQIYGYVPKYTFFRQEGSNVKYVISREKWNVIARSLNAYHVKKGYESVPTPYSVTVNLSNQKNYYSVYYDAQEWINGHQWTCGPTAMSMISQALNCYSSERKLVGTYSANSNDGTSENNIIKYSPLVHMKLTDIANNKNSVKNSLLNGKMVFWHISGHYMCIIGHNQVQDTFLCLNPSGPSHNIAAVQWATWTQIMNTDKKLKDHGFMAVTPYWNLTSLEKTHAMNYFNNMGGKYIVPNNSEYPNRNNNNYKVIVNSTKKITTTNQTTLHIKAEVKLNSQLANTGKVEISLNGKVISTQSIKNGVVSTDYTLPAYMDNTIEVKAKYFDAINITKTEVKNIFYKFSAGKTFINTTNLGNLESIKVFDVTGKKSQVLVFKAIVQDCYGQPVNNGEVVFKINGNTIKKSGQPHKIKVANGIATYNYVVPAYTAKKYSLTAVFGNTSTRLEDTAIMTLNRLSTKIVDVNVISKGSSTTISAQVVDEFGNKVERDTKVSIKINGRTLINKLKVQNGTINTVIDSSAFNNKDIKITIIAGENGLYQTSSINKTFSTLSQKFMIKITNYKSVTSSSNARILAKVVDIDGNEIKEVLKATLKINGKTLLNKVLLQNGNVDMNVDFSIYSRGTHNLTLIIGESTLYKSTSLNTTIVKS